MNQAPRVPPTSTAIRPARPVARPDALRDTEKPRASAAARTRAVVAAETRSDPRRARDTVATETPARAATSAIVASGSGIADAPLQAWD